jgi:predicted DNA-binding protein (UPF0251 family)
MIRVLMNHSGFILLNKKFMVNNMRKLSGRQRGNRRVGFNHKINFYKPQGIPLKDLEVIELSFEELEALRLKNVEQKSQDECANIMKTSQSTFQRILSEAYRKISEGLVEGKAIKIIKG